MKAFAYNVKNSSLCSWSDRDKLYLMGRLEAFALGTVPGPSFLDCIGNGLAMWILVAVGFFRELLALVS